MNKWNIPEWLEQEVIERDRNCVYCRLEFVASNSSRKTKPSWEHIINDAKIVTRENIALCCISCNASKGAKKLVDWLESKFCKNKGITKESVADIVKNFLATQSSDSTNQ